MAQYNEKISDFSDEMYKLLAENSPDILLQTTKTGKIIYMSRNVESEFGYKLIEVIGKHFRNFVPGSEIPKLLLKMREMISGKTVIGFRTFAKHKDGNLIPIELSGKFIKHNNKSYFNAVMRNISEKINSEKALRDSEIQRKFILDTIPDLLFIINSEGIFTSYHGNIKNLYQPPDFFINKKVEDVLPDDLGKTTIKFVKRALKTKKIQIFEYFLKMNKNIRWFEARMLAINKNEVISIVRDITSLKEQQEEILKNKEYLESLINSASEIIFTIDKRMNIIVWNESAAILSNFSSKEIINKHYNKSKLVNNYTEFDLYLSELFNNQHTDSFEIIINTKFKTKKILRVSPSLIYNKEKKVTEVLFICKDITFKKEFASKIIFGKSYIFLDDKNDRIIDIFNTKLTKKSNGIVITRELVDNNINYTKSNIEIIYLSSKNQKNKCVNDLPSFFSLLDKKIKSYSIIFIDRLDYFFNKYSFNEILSVLYKINDIVKIRNALFLIRFNPNLLSNDKIAILQEEFFEYSSIKMYDITIDKDLYEILTYIHSRNEKNIIVTYKEIGLKFSISKITVSKKIDRLIDLSLVKSYRSGRTKILYLTDFGKNIIKNKKT